MVEALERVEPAERLLSIFQNGQYGYFNVYLYHALFLGRTLYVDRTDQY